tara:strand:+ start:5921 stop:6055 length:135 start_codon:yes stop_codon:yes gene_type:complete
MVKRINLLNKLVANDTRLPKGVPPFLDHWMAKRYVDDQLIEDIL